MRIAIVVLVLLAGTAAAEPTEDELVTTILARPAEDIAVHHAHLLLDRLNRQGRLDELIAWTDRMLAMPKLMARHAELRETLHRVRVEGRRRRAQRLTDSTHTTADWFAAAEAWRMTALVAPGEQRFVLWLTAARAYTWGGAPVHALAAYAELEDAPPSMLVDARTSLGVLLVQLITSPLSAVVR